MSTVNELIKELREIANCYYGEICSYAGKIEEAADTIESLSAKLQAVNEEQTADCGGWIPCSERLPMEKGWYLVYAKNQRPFVAYFKGKTFPLNNHYHEIVAWQLLPDSYHEH